MTKKPKSRLKTKKVQDKYKKPETQIQKKEQTFLCKLQQVVEESCNKNRDSNDSGRVLIDTRNISKKSSSRRDPAFAHTNVRNEDTECDNYTCYRCRHFLEIPRNLSRPFNNRTSTFLKTRCEEELNFVQAIVWLKSATAYASQIPVEQLQQIFDRQWNARGDRHREDEPTDVEQLRSSVNKNLSVSEGENLRDTFATSTPLNLNIFGVQCVTPQRTILYARSEEHQDAPSKLSVTANDPTQSPVESLILQSSNNCHITAREKKKIVSSSIIPETPETDVESILSEDHDMFYGITEHQCFEFEKDTGCSGQNASKSGIKQINKKVIEDKHILQKSHADVPSQRKSILPGRNQSIDPIFDFENNFNRECCITMGSQNNDKTSESDGSPRSLIITQKDVSEISSINTDEYFECLLDDTSSLQMSNTVAGNLQEDSAYSTSRYDIFNYDTAIEARIIAGNKRLSDTEHYSKLLPCKQKKTMYETEKVCSSIDGMSTSDGSPKSLIITQKDISQISDVYSNENSEFQIVNSYDERMSDIFQIFEDDAAVATKSIGDKCTPNIEHHHEQHSRNEKTIIHEKMMASTSIIQEAAIPNTNIQHRYNLRHRNNRRISLEKEALSIITEKPEEHESGRAQSLLEKENENEDKMISADWLNITLESLRIEHAIIKSIKVILSTLCDKETMEEYMMKERLRNTRNYWKGSLEEEAVNTVLNVSDIFTTEKKPNICIEVIMKAIVKTLNEMTMCALNKICYTETSMWIYRVHIILEFCNSLPICVKVIDYLITKLKSLQSVLTNEGKIQKNTYVMINQLHLVFYALNITLRKYRTIIPSDQRSRPVEKMIPHVADLWKIQYIIKELEYTDLDLDAAEKRWLNALENSAVVFTKHFEQFAEKSLSLVHVLIP